MTWAQCMRASNGFLRWLGWVFGTFAVIVGVLTFVIGSAILGVLVTGLGIIGFALGGLAALSVFVGTMMWMED